MRRFVTVFIFSLILLILFPTPGICTTQGTQFLHDEIDSEMNTNNNITTQQLDHYTTSSELSTILRDISSEYNDITDLYHDFGRTYEEHSIWLVKISDNPEIHEDDEPEVLFVGAHHGNELIGNEVAIYIIKSLTNGYGHDPRITWLVDNHQIWVVPMLNPDGAEYTLNVESWRKNRSPNYLSEVTPGPIDPKVYPTSYGTDLNRNYDIEWGDPGGSSVLLQRSGTYAGSEPFSELETQAMRDFVLAHNLSMYMDYHSGTELILYPWGHTSDPTPDKVLYERIGETFTKLTGYDTIQGYDLYQTNGDAIDWVYSETRALSFTVELSYEYRPGPELTESIKDNQIKLPLYLTGISADPDFGSQLEIIHANIGNQSDLGPYQISAYIMGIPRVTNLNVKLFYKINNEDFQVIPMESTSEQPNQYIAEIPTQGPDTIVQYFIMVTDDNIQVCFPDNIHTLEFSIKPLPESITTTDEIVAMIIMMIIILGFFWGGFAYAARIALLAERRKLHDYQFGE